MNFAKNFRFLTLLGLSGWGCGDGSGIRVSALEAPSGGKSQSADPALAIVPGSGDLMLSWIEGDGKVWELYTAKSTDGGGKWSSPVRVAGGAEAPDEVHPHGESSPRLVVAPEGRVALVWPNNIAVPGRKWPAAMLRFARSVDGGLHWSNPITLNDDTTGAMVSHQFHGAAWSGDSGLTVAWLDERGVAAQLASGSDGHAEHAAEPDASIYLATSPDFGRSWGPNRRAWDAACPCCRVSLARGRDGQALAAWRQHFPGNVRDVVIAVAGDRSSEPKRVHRDDWAYAGCPHTGPAIATGSDGGVHVAWYTGKEGGVGVYYARQTAEGSGPAVDLVTGRGLGVAHPAVVALPDGGALAAYDVAADGKRQISLARLLPSGSVGRRLVVEGSEEGKYPQLAVLNDSVVVVAWTRSNGDKSELKLAQVHARAPKKK
ncbi:MAG: hypothetical protein ACXWWN_11215 [Gemmatimonadales bacterium]